MDSESESDSGEPAMSDGEGSKKALPTPKEETVIKAACPKKLLKTTKKKVTKKSEEKVPENNEEDAIKIKRIKKLGALKEKEVEEKKNTNDGSVEDVKNTEEPKGRDFDLNEIRSELKGIDKAVKVNTELAIADSPEVEKIVTEEKIVGKAPIAEEPVVVLAVPSLALPLVEPPKEVEKEVIKIEEKPLEKNDIKDDIYEFKEPEPFEYQEVLRPMNRLYEDGDRSPDKTVKKPVVLPEKKDVCKFEVDVKSRFRKTIGKKMKEVNNIEVKKKPVLKSEKLEIVSKAETFLANDYPAKPPEKEIPVLKVEVEIPKSVSPEPIRVYPVATEDVSFF